MHFYAAYKSLPLKFRNDFKWIKRHFCLKSAHKCHFFAKYCKCLNMDRSQYLIAGPTHDMLHIAGSSKYDEETHSFQQLSSFTSLKSGNIFLNVIKVIH